MKARLLQIARRREAAALAFGVALTLPRLGSFGLWEPGELRIAEAARGIARDGGGLLDVVGRALAAGPPARALLPAVGMRLFGVGEWGARALVAAMAVATLLAVTWAGAALFGSRAGRLAGLVLGTSALFVLEARQLSSDMLLLLGGSLALGGLGRFARRGGDERFWRDLAIAAAGMAIGTLAGGVLLGVLVPALAVLAALAVAGRATDAARRKGLRIAIGAFAVGTAIVAAVVLLRPHAAGHPSWLLGGTPRVEVSAHTFDALVRTLGFGLFPWSALAFFALARPLVALDGGDSRRVLAGMMLLMYSAFGLALGTAQLHLVDRAGVCVLPAAALAVAVLLDDCLAPQGREPMLALLAAVGTALVARDFLLTPEELASVHLDAKIAWPVTVSIKVAMAAAAILFTGGLLGTLAAPRALARRWLALAVRAAPAVTLGAAVAFALYVSHALVPALSRHLSHKALVETYQRQGGARLARYHLPREGSGAFDGAESFELGTPAELAALFRRDPRAFALIPRDELAALGDALADAGVPYAVADSSSSRALLLAARLPAGVPDQNPLGRALWRPARPEAPPPWDPPQVAASAVYGDAIELEGADFPAAVRRPGSLPVALHFKVRRRPPPDYKIFVHLERPGEPLVNGDHAPVEGALPTGHWRAGDRVRDQHDVALPLMTTSAGLYTLSVGLWPGGDNVRRLPITSGENDGQNRTRLGTVRVQ